LLAIIRRGGAATKLLWRRHGGTIMIFGGATSILAGTFFACKSTLKVDETLKKREAEKQKIEDLHSGKLLLGDGKEYTEADYKKDILIVKTGTALDFLKLYWLSLAFIGGGLGMMVKGDSMHRKELASSVALSAAIKKSYDGYRARVREQYGEEAEENLYHGVEEKEEETVVINENGKKKTEVVKYHASNGMPSPYARYFDQTNPNWRGREDYDFVFLKQLQNDLNDMFYMNYGYLLWNTALQRGGWPMTKAGQRAGWVNSGDGSTDGFVDFGIFDKHGKAKQWALDMYRREGRILVDFNVDGDVIDKIPLDDI